MWLGVQGKAEQRLGGAERRLGGVGEAAELCGAAELLGVQGKAEQRLGGGLVGRSGGLAGRSGGLAERGRRWSFVEQQSFWVFPLQLGYGVIEVFAKAGTSWWAHMMVT